MKKQDAIPSSVFAQIEQEIPKILAKVSQKSSDFLTNEASHRNALVIGYEFLPLVIRLVVSEEKFVNFCMANKERIFGKVKPSPKKTASKTAIPVKKTTTPKATVTPKKVTEKPKVAAKTSPKAITKTAAPPAKVAAQKPKESTTKSKTVVAQKAPAKK